MITLRNEGGLLPLDMLTRIASEDKSLPGHAGESYGLNPGERLRDSINRAWNGLLARWRAFCVEREKLQPGDAGLKLTRDRWLFPLFNELGFGRQLPKANEETLNGKVFAISHRWENIPLHLLGCGVDLDAPQKLGSGARVSPHGHLQDFLNCSEACLWGMLSNGHLLRLLRDHHSLTQRAYIEFDLQAMMEGEHFSDFSLLYMLCHQSRFTKDKGEECFLEQWHKLAQEEGIRALEGLREGVEKAIEALGSGFLKHKGNKELQRSLQEGTLSKQDYYHQLLQVVYRLIFCFVAEDRDALLDPKAPAEARERYTLYYSSKRLRDLSGRRRGGPHVDGWRGLCVVLDKLHDGCPELGLPALGSFLWRASATPDLKKLDLANEDLYLALNLLCYKQQKDARYAISFKNIGSEELGSVYESLLERHPSIDRETGRFELSTVAGHERKTTGSYYTPRSLVDCLLDSALNPVLEEACKQANAEQAILNLKICDPACGSGHFLVAAARRVALKLAGIRSGGDEPSPREIQRALRDVVGHCIYGVDLNPMAVELCKVSLWMEGIEPGRPLSFLESHIRQGNALLGATPALLKDGIRDEAFELLEGDDKEVGKRLKKRNREARKTGQMSLLGGMSRAPMSFGRLAAGAKAVEAASDETLGAVLAKEEDWERYTGSEEYQASQFLADAWCASFVWEKRKELEDAAVTQDLWMQLEGNAAGARVKYRATWKEVARLARAYSFFHWHLAFPQVFFGVDGEKGGAGWPGGFGVVLGNPPWERVKLQEQEFFASKSEAITKAANAAARKKLIAALPKENPELWKAWCLASREAEGQSHFARVSGRYPLCGKGDVNTYALFAEHNRTILGGRGRAGFIVPTGIATDDTTKEYFGALVKSGSLHSLYDFRNKGFFDDVASAQGVRIALVTLGPPSPSPIRMLFRATNVAEIQDEERCVLMWPDEIALANPNTKTTPTFHCRRDAKINLTIYRRAGVLWREGEPDLNPWGLSFMRMLDMANDSGLFRTRAQLQDSAHALTGNCFEGPHGLHLPLIEAKMVHHFDHRHGDYALATITGKEVRQIPQAPIEVLNNPFYAALPRYWVAASEVNHSLTHHWKRDWLLGWRDITTSVDVRTVIACVIPRVAVGHTTPLMFPDAEPPLIASLYANLCSFALDYAARQKVGGTHLTYGYLKQLPVLAPSTYLAPCPWDNTKTLKDWILPRVLELSFTAWDLQSFAKDIDYHGPPFRWDPERRFGLRAELDAAFFHLYGLSLDDSAYILDTFSIVRKNDEKTHGNYRTKQKILEIHQAMSEAIQQKSTYKSLITPPPADPSQAHAQKE